MTPIKTTDELSAALTATKRVLVFVYTPIYPCRAMFPMMDVFSRDAAKRMDVYSVNANESPAVALDQLRVTVVPVVQLWHHGKLIKQICGVQTRETLMNNLQGHI